MPKPILTTFLFIVAALCLCAKLDGQPLSLAGPTPSERSAEPNPPPRDEANTGGFEQPYPPGRIVRSGGLTGIAPDGSGATTLNRTYASLVGRRNAAQISQTIELRDGATGPPSEAGKSTADSASYVLSLINIRPDWATSGITGEADGLSMWIRQASGDTAALLANIGVRSGFAATLESYTFAADRTGQPTRAVRTQLGVVNSRDGGEYGLVLQAAAGDQLAAGVRIASIGTATWRNYFEAVDPMGRSVAYIRGSDGAFVGGDLMPEADLQSRLGAPERRYTATFTQVLQLAETTFADLPRCGAGVGDGTLARISDARKRATAWGQTVRAGGGRYKAFVKCDGTAWLIF